MTNQRTGKAPPDGLLHDSVHVDLPGARPAKAHRPSDAKPIEEQIGCNTCWFLVCDGTNHQRTKEPLLDLARKAVAAMEARKDEDIDEWAERLAADSIAAGEAEYEARSNEVGRTPEGDAYPLSETALLRAEVEMLRRSLGRLARAIPDGVELELDEDTADLAALEWAKGGPAEPESNPLEKAFGMLSDTPEHPKENPREPVVWADEASPFTGPQVKALLEENKKLRKVVEAAREVVIRWNEPDVSRPVGYHMITLTNALIAVPSSGGGQ